MIRVAAVLRMILTPYIVPSVPEFSRTHIAGLIVRLSFLLSGSLRGSGSGSFPSIPRYVPRCQPVIEVG